MIFSKRSILEEIRANLQKVNDDFGFAINEDRLNISYQNNDTLFKTSVRCQNFGDVYLLNPQGIQISNNKIENQFKKLILNQLIKYYDDDITLLTTTSSLKIETDFIDYKIVDASQIKDIAKSVHNWLSMVVFEFLNNVIDIKGISDFINCYSYQDNLKVNTGGLFPVQTFKKIYLLYLGGHIERYQEYKEGLYEQLISFPIRKPEKKEEAKIFLNNFNFIIKELESGNFERTLS